MKNYVVLTGIYIRHADVIVVFPYDCARRSVLSSRSFLGALFCIGSKAVVGVY